MISIGYPKNECTDGAGHWYVNLSSEIWWCKKCWVAKWQPADILTAREFGIRVNTVGVDRAYAEVMKQHKDIAAALTRLSAIRAVKVLLPGLKPNSELLLAAVANRPVVNDHPYRLRHKIVLNKVWLELELVMAAAGSGQDWNY